MRIFIRKPARLLVTLALAGAMLGCGSESDAATGDFRLFEGGEYSLSVDPEWSILTPSDFRSGIPKETLVGFASPEAYDGFFLNVNVVRESLDQALSSIDYGRANINLAGRNLTDYQKIQEAKVDLGGTASLLHIFEARVNPSQPKIRFFQVYATKGAYGYIASGGMLPATPKEIRERIGAMVTSFRLK